MKIIISQMSVFIFILILSLSSSSSIASQSAPYSDNFNSSTINPIWKKSNYGQVNVTQKDGVLNGAVTNLDFFNSTASLQKSISSNITKIDLDYAFNFTHGMGRIYVIGKDNLSDTVWAVGMYDGSMQFNAQPIISIYKKNNVINSNVSWDQPSGTSNRITNSGGSGHIRISFKTATSLNIEFSFPETTNNQTFRSFSATTFTATTGIQLYFWFPADSFSAQGEYYMFDNYQENSPVTTFPNSSINVTTIPFPLGNFNPLNFSSKVIVIQSQSNNPFSNFELVLALVVIVVAIYAVTKRRHKKMNNDDDSNTITQNRYTNNKLTQTRTENTQIQNLNTFKQVENRETIKIPEETARICSFCSTKNTDKDIFCSNCGTRLKTT